VFLYADSAAQLASELEALPERPPAVHVSPGSDPFPPLGAFQAETGRVVEVLAERGVDAWLETRGYIRPSVLSRLAKQRERVKIVVGLTTLDRDIQRITEPMAAPPRLRLRQVRRLRELGLSVRVAVEPLIPGVTDTRARLAALLDALAAIGVRRLTAGYLSLRPGLEESFAAALAERGISSDVLAAYRDGPVHSAGAGLARYLPKTRRQQGYAALMSLAAGYGITVGVSAGCNPDFPRLVSA
jgi:DNA repair photolyase